MEEELKELKCMLRSLVVSSAAAMDAAMLARDYRLMLGEPLPFARFGYRDQVTFLRERCSDCFLFQGQQKNPTLTLIVPDSLKHIDKFVQKQKTAGVKGKFKRRSVPESTVKPVCETNMIVKTFRRNTTDQETEVINREQAPSVNSFLRKRIPLLESLQVELKKNQESHQEMRSERTLEHESGSRDENVGPAGTGNTGAAGAENTGAAGAENTGAAGSGNTGAAGAENTGAAGTGNTGAPGAQRVGSDTPLAERTSAHRPATPPSDIDDALPGVPYEAGVFPDDCIHYMESIPALGVGELRVHDTIDVITAEVYSPSHLWLIRLGEQHSEAMERVMDEMNQYYRGEGGRRELLAGAVRAGHHVACCYLGDWHRALIVRVLDCDTVKVRHVDYGTVQQVAARALRPLLRCWAQLPAQALRARLGGVRPAAGARRWPLAAALHVLRLVRDRPLAATVAARDLAEDCLEVFLADWAGGRELLLHRALVDSGLAEAAPPLVHTRRAVFQCPAFSALEQAATPTLDDLLTFRRVGIDADCVPEYAAHVPPLLEPLRPPPPPPAPPPPPPPPPPRSMAQCELLALLARVQPGLARQLAWERRSQPPGAPPPAADSN